MPKKPLKSKKVLKKSVVKAVRKTTVKKPTKSVLLRKIKTPLTAQKIYPEFLIKHHGNPIIEPRPHIAWESKATFNPGAVEVGGKIHLLYRAIGDQDISVVGHA